MLRRTMFPRFVRFPIARTWFFLCCSFPPLALTHLLCLDSQRFPVPSGRSVVESRSGERERDGRTKREGKKQQRVKVDFTHTAKEMKAERETRKRLERRRWPLDDSSPYLKIVEANNLTTLRKRICRLRMCALCKKCFGAGLLHINKGR